MHQLEVLGKKSWIPLAREIIMQQDFLYGLTCGYSLEKCSIIGSNFSIQCDTSGGYNLIKEKMGRNKVKLEALLQA